MLPSSAKPPLVRRCHGHEGLSAGGSFPQQPPSVSLLLRHPGQHGGTLCHCCRTFCVSWPQPYIAHCLCQSARSDALRLLRRRARAPTTPSCSLLGASWWRRRTGGPRRAAPLRRRRQTPPCVPGQRLHHPACPCAAMRIAAQAWRHARPARPRLQAAASPLEEREGRRLALPGRVWPTLLSLTYVAAVTRENRRCCGSEGCQRCRCQQAAR